VIAIENVPKIVSRLGSAMTLFIEDFTGYSAHSDPPSFMTLDEGEGLFD
jgi:hypothetical protein